MSRGVFFIKSEVVLRVCTRLTSGAMETQFFVLKHSHGYASGQEP